MAALRKEGPTRVVAGALSLLAAMAHGGLAPEHFSEWWGYGAFFAIAATAQALLGLALLLDALPTPRGRRDVALAGFAGQAILVAFYVLTRTWGIPFFGPGAGSVEEIAPIDVVTVAMEVLCAALLARHALRRPAPEPEPRHALDAAP